MRLKDVKKKVYCAYVCVRFTLLSTVVRRSPRIRHLCRSRRVLWTHTLSNLSRAGLVMSRFELVEAGVAFCVQVQLGHGFRNGTRGRFLQGYLKWQTNQNNTILGKRLFGCESFRVGRGRCGNVRAGTNGRWVPQRHEGAFPYGAVLRQTNRNNPILGKRLGDVGRATQSTFTASQIRLGYCRS